MKKFLLIGFLSACPVYGLPKPPKPSLTNIFIMSVNYDLATTRMWERNCPYCTETGPFRFALGKRPSTFRLSLGMSTEVSSVMLIPNRKIRTIVMIGAIAGHLYAGSQNLNNHR